MRCIRWTILFTLISFLAVSQEKGEDRQREVHIKGTIVNAPGQTLKLVQNLGKKQKIVAQTELSEDGSFALSFTSKHPEYYIVELSNGQKMNVVVERQDTIKIYGDANDLSTINNVINSEATTLLNEFMTDFRSYKSVEDSLRNVLKSAEDRDAKLKEIQEYFNPIASRFMMKRNKFIKQHLASPAIIGPLNAVNYQKEPDLWKKISKSIVNSMPGSYTAKALQANLKKIKQQENKKKMFTPGKKVPDIALPNPEGDTLRLSDLEGNVVLIDFWASWCGPCRKENPNVVKTYKEFHDKGFEIYSVSLDRKKDRWRKAIQADNLTWPNHVSDLKGWRSQAAQEYNVSSIPFTVLIDKEGKVIKTNLRGERLHKELSSIFSKED